MIRKRLATGLLCVVPLMLLTGCWGRMEPEQLAFVIAIGLDAGPDGQLITTFQIANPEIGTSLIGAQTPEEKASEIVTVVANDLLSARNVANAFVSRKITFSQTRIIVVSQKLARMPTFPQILYSSVRERELRRNNYLLVCDGTAEDFIRKNDPVLETRPHKYYQFMIKRATETGMVPENDLMEYYQTTSSDYGLYLAMFGSLHHAAIRGKNADDKNEDGHVAGGLPSRGDVSAQLTGSAVFREGRMVGLMTGEETRLALLLKQNTQNRDMIVTLRDPLSSAERIPVRVKSANEQAPEIKVDLKNKTIRVNMFLSLELVAIPSMIDYTANSQKLEVLKESFEDEIRSKFMNLIARSQQEFKGDPFEWSLIARRSFLLHDDFVRMDWMETFPRMNVDVQVVVDIAEMGKQVRAQNMRKVED